MRKKEKKIYTESDLLKSKDTHLDKAKLILRATLKTALNFKNIDYDSRNTITFLSSEIDQISDIDEIVEANNKINTLLLELNNIKPQIKNKDLKKGYFISEFSYYSDIISDLLSSIKNNVELTASPLAQSIYELKRESSKFLKTFTDWKGEINDPNSKLNHSHVVSSFQLQSQNFNDYEKHIEKDFQYISTSLRKVEEMFNKISDITKHIDDIASNIKTLSINASIEAARAGEHGKGFKVIALGTKDLSDQTNKLLESIVTAVEDTKAIIFEASNTIERQKEFVFISGNQQQQGYQIFYNILVEFYSRFDSVFSEISKGTDEVNKHIDDVAPMIQLHDALIQEVDNISQMLTKLNKSNDDVINSAITKLSDKELTDLINNLVTKFEEQITTDGEVDVLGNFAKKHKLDRQRAIEKVDKDIEFF